MPIFKTCAVILTGNKEVYRKGEKLTGSLVLDVNEDVVVKGVRVFLYGESLAMWDEFSPGTLGGTKDYIAREKYIGWVHTVFGKKQNVKGPNHTLTAGRHKYNYTFNIPSRNLPSSYEGENGGIRYWLKVEVDRPFPHFNQNWYRGITILDDINVNDAKYKNPVRKQAKKQVSKALGIGDAGTLTLTSSTDRGAYCSGEKIALGVLVKNETTKDLGKLKAQFVQKVVFTANNETKTREDVLRVLEGTPIKASEERVWKDQLLVLDAIPPSTVPASCHIVNVTYYIKVIVEVPLGLNLDTILPVTIGTVPYGHTPNAPRGASAHEIDASSAITYTKCNRGIRICRKYDGNFPNYGYTPMCAYVPNYVFPPPKPALARTAAPRQTAATTTTARPAAATTPRPAAATARPAAAARPAMAAPLPQKNPLPPPTVSVPSPGMAQSPMPPLPTAPPMELPPAYDDIFNTVTPAARQETATSVERELADRPYGLLILRFPDHHLQEFRDNIEKEIQTLKKFDGEVIALAPQTIAQTEEWPSRTSAAILKFESVEAATEWFNTTPGIANTKWLNSCDAMVTKIIEQFQEESKLFTMSKTSLRPNVARSKIGKYNKLVVKTLRPLRLRMKGVNLSHGKNYTTLRGHWIDDHHMFSVTQWESIEKIFDYKREKTLGANKDCTDLMTEIFDVQPAVVFQSEDLSPFQVALAQSVERADSPAVEIQAETPHTTDVEDEEEEEDEETDTETESDEEEEVGEQAVPVSEQTETAVEQTEDTNTYTETTNALTDTTIDQTEATNAQRSSEQPATVHTQTEISTDTTELEAEDDRNEAAGGLNSQTEVAADQTGTTEEETSVQTETASDTAEVNSAQTVMATETTITNDTTEQLGAMGGQETEESVEQVKKPKKKKKSKSSRKLEPMAAM